MSAVVLDSMHFDSIQYSKGMESITYEGSCGPNTSSLVRTQFKSHEQETAYVLLIAIPIISMQLS